MNIQSRFDDLGRSLRDRRVQVTSETADPFAFRSDPDWAKIEMKLLKLAPHTGRGAIYKSGTIKQAIEGGSIDFIRAVAGKLTCQDLTTDTWSCIDDILDDEFCDALRGLGLRRSILPLEVIVQASSRRGGLERSLEWISGYPSALREVLSIRQEDLRRSHPDIIESVLRANVTARDESQVAWDLALYSHIKDGWAAAVVWMLTNTTNLPDDFTPATPILQRIQAATSQHARLSLVAELGSVRSLLTMSRTAID